MADVNIFNFFSSSWWKDYQDSKTQSEIKKRLTLAQVVGYLLSPIILFIGGFFEKMPRFFPFFLTILSLLYAFLYTLHWKNIQRGHGEITKTAKTISILNVFFEIVGFIINIIILVIVVAFILKW